MINDAHIHVGQFYQTYNSPQLISSLLHRLEVNRYAVSSTTTCEKNYQKVCAELKELIELDGDRVCPILWCSPDILDNLNILNYMRNSGIKWSCVKIHPDWQPYTWSRNIENQHKLLKLANKLRVPILIHTGGSEYSQVDIWTSLINDNPQQTFILAHMRPFEKTIKIITNHDNAYGDLAFVDTSDFKEISLRDLSHKILWGTDIPIVDRYISYPIERYYHSVLNRLRQSVSPEEYSMITFQNFERIFSPKLNY